MVGSLEAFAVQGHLMDIEVHCITLRVFEAPWVASAVEVASAA